MLPNSCGLPSFHVCILEVCILHDDLRKIRLSKDSICICFPFYLPIKIPFSSCFLDSKFSCGDPRTEGSS